MSGVSRLRRGWLGILERLQERGGEGRRGEGEEVEANEEDFVEGATDEENDLGLSISIVRFKCHGDEFKLTLLW